MRPYLAAACRARRMPACSDGAAAAVTDPSALGCAAGLRRSSALAGGAHLCRVRSLSDMKRDSSRTWKCRTALGALPSWLQSGAGSASVHNAGTRSNIT